MPCSCPNGSTSVHNSYSSLKLLIIPGVYSWSWPGVAHPPSSLLITTLYKCYASFLDCWAFIVHGRRKYDAGPFAG
jgi:hypothetical protein